MRQSRGKFTATKYKSIGELVRWLYDKRRTDVKSAEEDTEIRHRDAVVKLELLRKQMEQNIDEAKKKLTSKFEAKITKERKENETN